MKIKFSIALLALTTSGAALGQGSVPNAAQAPTAQQMAVQQTAVAFGQCVSSGLAGVTASVSAQAGASTVLGGCATQRDQLVGAARALIATLPEAERAAATQELENQLGQAQARVAAEIERRRAAASAAPAR
jgi:hypothetical protein